jgi:hypothetical protein
MKPLLEQFLDGFLNDYFMVLCVVNYEGDDEGIPVIIIVHDEKNEEELPQFTQFPSQIKDSDEFVLIMADGDTSICAVDIDFPIYRAYHKRPISGTSIEAREYGTVGLFVEDGENKFVGITCAHVAGTTEEKCHISQPNVEDLKEYIMVLRQAFTSLQTEISESKNEVLIFERKKALKFVEDELKVVEPLLETTDHATRKNLRLGRVRASENEVVDFRGRQCIADWSIFDIYPARHPAGVHIMQYAPNKGLLSRSPWKKAASIGSIKLDMFVRKLGARTGLTHGFIGGVYGSGKFLGTKVEEFWALEEREESRNRFADKGDSGSAVISNEGELVGFVYGKRKIKNIKIICDKKTRIPDISRIRELRGSTNEDIEDVYSRVFLGQIFVLIESAEMVLERSGVGTNFVKDC